MALIHHALQLSAHILTDHKDQLPYQLTGRLWSYRHQDDIADLYAGAVAQSAWVWAENLPNPPLEQAGGALKHILHHTHSVSCMAYSPDK
ncbi:MAG TPA: hypothetical protein PLZ51_27570, partial [Aggregatilineales bacterium]|nr:hypothetical protein [Aggregatilineales bacterium]